MYLLIKVEGEEELQALRAHLGSENAVVREFSEPEYRIKVTAEERRDRKQADPRNPDVNPRSAWKTCASLKRIWDWDSLNRGPCPKTEHQLQKTGDTAPPGKGFVDGERVAGECANPTYLNYISCPMWCTKYEPTSLEAWAWVAEAIAAEHEERAVQLRDRIDFLKLTNKTYRELVEAGEIHI